MPWIGDRYVFIVHPEIAKQLREASDEFAAERRRLAAERRRREFHLVEDQKS
jgi:hypothetical protein